MSHTPAILAEIIEHKKREVEQAKAAISFSDLRDAAVAQPPPRDFFAAVTGPSPTAVIAEVKRQSPSAGLIRPEYAGDGFRPEQIARRYHACGASAISCLTDEKFFGGHLSFMQRIRSAVPLPVLRKDFIIDPFQLWEARAHGADAALLIAECLDDDQLDELLSLTQTLAMSTLVEVHDEANLARVWPRVAQGPRRLLGINNRDLRTMKVDLEHTPRLLETFGDRNMFVSESGIRTNKDLRRLREVGVRIVLVGEHLMKQSDPGDALSALLTGP